MSFLQVSGPSRGEAFPKKASTAFAVNEVLAFETGKVLPAVAASASLAGVCMKKVASTDDDYAQNTALPLIALDPESEFEADVETGTAAATDIGSQKDLATSTGVDMTASTHKQVTITGFISTTKVRVKFNGAYIYKDAS